MNILRDNSCKRTASDTGKHEMNSIWHKVYTACWKMLLQSYFLQLLSAILYYQQLGTIKKKRHAMSQIFNTSKFLKTLSWFRNRRFSFISLIKWPLKWHSHPQNTILRKIYVQTIFVNFVVLFFLKIFTVTVCTLECLTGWNGSHSSKSYFLKRIPHRRCYERWQHSRR